MNILCLGAGDVGSQLARTLRAEGHVVVVVDRDTDKLQALEGQADVQTLTGNAANLVILEEARAAQADLVLCVTADDEVNMLSCLLSKGLGAQHVIVRIKNPEYLAGRRYFYRKILGCDFLISPEEMASEEICKVIQEHATIAVEFFADGKVQMRQLRINDEVGPVGKKLKEIKLPALALIAAIFRHGEIIIPSGETELQSEDQILVVGETKGVENVVSFFGKNVSKPKNIVIVGGGEVGFGVAHNFRHKNYHITLVEQSLEQARWLSKHLPNCTIIHGDGMNAELLKEERIDAADVVVATCKEDEKNFIICQIARELGVRKTVASVEKAEYVPLYQKLGVDVTVSPRMITAQRIIAYVLRERVHSLAVLEEGKAEVLEFQVKAHSKIVGKPLSKIGLPQGSVIGVIVRGEDILVPRGDSVVQDRDRVIVFTRIEVIPKIVKYFS